MVFVANGKMFALSSVCIDVKMIDNHFCFILQARNTVNKEIVAIKKMSYNGRQSEEVRKKETDCFRWQALFSVGSV